MTRRVHPPAPRTAHPRIVLDAAAFTHLVRGEAVELVAHDGTTIAVLLADIGLARLANLLLAAIDATHAGAGACRVCGCTDERACRGGCYWVTPDLCSRRCAGRE